MHDNSISKLYRGLVTRYAEDPGNTLTQDAAVRILARVGDKRGESANLVLRELESKELSPEQKVELIRKGMTSNEREDLAQIVDSGVIPLTSAARDLFEQVIRRNVHGPDDVRVTPDQSQGILGSAKPGDVIEGVNLSAIPPLRIHVTDTTVIGTADASGQFQGTLSGEQALEAGDVVRLRAHHADGKAGDWLTFKAQGLGPDVRNAQVAAARIGLNNLGNGQIALFNLSEGREISEPGAQLRFTNQTTGKVTLITLDDDGSFAPTAQLSGAPGDAFSLAVSDGVNNPDFAVPLDIPPLVVPDTTGNQHVDLVPDPTTLKTDRNADGTSKFGKTSFTGTLYSGLPSANDPQQGQIGDCYVPSAIAALAVNHAAELAKAVEDNGDGTYTVHFKKRGLFGYKDVPIKVDGDLYTRSWGGPVYGASTGSHDPASMKLLFPLIEKAFATWKGGYQAIGNGGNSSELFEAILGERPDFISVRQGDVNGAWKTITHAIDNKLPISAGTFGEDQEARYVNTGVYADHSYSVLGYDAAKQTVTLRNPWGESEPAGNGANDGVFQLDMPTFTKLFDDVMTTRN